MSTIAIDNLTQEFYNTISFKNGIVPDITTLHTIFHGGGLMINNSFETAKLYTAQSFVQEFESQVALGETQQFLQREISSRTEVFGKAAQRTSVYEYTYADYHPEVMPRGINFIQYVQIGDNWHIMSMVWNDENENYQIPHEYLAARG